jgi:glycosyltransferase involved in cell wall biosynthesis
MRVLIVTTQVPFIRGGAEALADGLLDALRRAGHQAEIVAVPFKWYPPSRIAEQMLACRLLDLTEVSGRPIDRLIGLKFPAYLAPHPSKSLWLVHQHRQAYDQWETPLGDIHPHAEGRAVREAIVRADSLHLSEIPPGRRFAISRNVADRLQRFNGLSAGPLYPPLESASRYRCGRFGDVFLFPSRIDDSKRQMLAVEAMRHVRSGARLALLGRPDHPSSLERIRAAVAEWGLDGRVEYLGAPPDDDKIAALAECRTVIFPPKDEDYGFVTLEAMYSGKPVITCADSGGPLEFVTDGREGLVTEPTPRALAAAIDRLAESPAEAERLGAAGRERIAAMDLSWEKVVAALLGEG